MFLWCNICKKNDDKPAHSVFNSDCLLEGVPYKIRISNQYQVIRLETNVADHLVSVKVGQLKYIVT